MPHLPRVVPNIRGSLLSFCAHTKRWQFLRYYMLVRRRCVKRTLLARLLTGWVEFSAPIYSIKPGRGSNQFICWAGYIRRYCVSNLSGRTAIFVYFINSLEDSSNNG